MKNKTINFVFILLLLMGLYFPTSENGEINVKNEQIMLLMLIFILAFLLVFNKKFRTKSWKKIFNSYSIVFIIIFFTLISLLKGYNQFFLGVLAQYIILSLLFLSDYTSIVLTDYSKKIFILVNIINITLGFMIVFDNVIIEDFFYNHYSAFYPELLYNMFMGNKPVIMFASHGLASAFYYLCFFMLFHSFIITKSKLHFILAILNLVLLFYTKSTTAYALFIAAIINITHYLYKKSRNKTLVLIPILSVFVIALIVVSKSSLMPDFNSITNGFNARYSNNGILKPTIDYIINNPFTPVGIASIPDLFNADSGWIINMLRGSIFLIVAIYTGFYLFLKTNMQKNIVIWTFLIFAALELGGLIITYLRMMYFLPFFVVYLNNLYGEQRIVIIPVRQSHSSGVV